MGKLTLPDFEVTEEENELKKYLQYLENEKESLEHTLETARKKVVNTRNALYQNEVNTIATQKRLGYDIVSQKELHAKKMLKKRGV